MVKRYLSVITLTEALALVENSFQAVPGVVRIPVTTGAVGRITAEPIFARFSVPAIHISAMDGIAVRSADTVGASEQNPVTLPDAARVNTGNIVPPEYDAVVMIEDVWVDDETYTVRKPVSAWQHIRPVGEDIGESGDVLPSHHGSGRRMWERLQPGGHRPCGLNVRVGLPHRGRLVPAGVVPPPGKVVKQYPDGARSRGRVQRHCY